MVANGSVDIFRVYIYDFSHGIVLGVVLLISRTFCQQMLSFLMKRNLIMDNNLNDTPFRVQYGFTELVPSVEPDSCSWFTGNGS